MQPKSTHLLRVGGTAVVLLLSSLVLGEHHCIHDQIQLKQIQSGVLEANHIVEETSLLRESRASPRGIVFRVGTATLDDSSKYCTAAGQKRPSLEGSTLTCTAEQVFTSEKKRYLIDHLLPSATSLISNALKNTPSGSFSLQQSDLEGNICSNFIVSRELENAADQDFIILVAAAPTSGNTIAWATTCLVSSKSNKPMVGVINVSPKYINGEMSTVRTVVHEIFHALGFSSLKSTEATMRGKTVKVVSSGQTKIKAREHYGCSDLEGMEVDDDGGAGTMGSHWKARAAKDDLMAGYASNIMYLTPMTLAYMEDSTFYAPNYDSAETMPFGYKAGCDFLREPCIQNGVSLFPDTWADRNTDRIRCSSDRLAVGGGYLASAENRNLNCAGTIYDYFGDGRCYDSSPYDYCPPIQPYTNTICRNTGDTVGRCINQDSSTGAECFNIVCDYSAKTFQIALSSSTIRCTSGGTFSSGGKRYVCPEYYEMCPYAGSGTDSSVKRTVYVSLVVTVSLFASLFL